jgi:DNA-binding response OmpR family regulator
LGERAEHAGPARVLIIDDDEGIRALCGKFVLSVGMEPHAAGEGESGMALVEKLRPEYVLLDINLPGRNGMDLLKDIRGAYPETRVVMITGYVSVDRAVTAMKLGAYDYLTKPFSPDRLREVLGAGRRAAPSAPPEVTCPPARIRRVWLIANSLFQRREGRCEYAGIRLHSGDAAVALNWRHASRICRSSLFPPPPR